MNQRYFCMPYNRCFLLFRALAPVETACSPALVGATITKTWVDDICSQIQFVFLLEYSGQGKLNKYD